MRTIFIADAHLRRREDDNYRRLLTFLETLRGNTETLFILGDLFEFWVGYPAGMPFSQYQPVLDRLRHLASSGVRIVYLEGNHDFHMGRYFIETVGARVHSGPAVVNLGGKRVYLCHGDQINSKDYGYRLLRLLLHNPAAAVLIPLAPVWLAAAVAERMSVNSSRKHPGRGSRWDYPAIIRAFAADRIGEGCDAVITGHFHMPFMETVAGGGVLLSLGDWIRQYSYGQYLDGEFSLRAFPG